MTETMRRRPLNVGPLAWCISEQRNRKIENHHCATCGSEMLGVGGPREPKPSDAHQNGGTSRPRATTGRPGA